MKDLLAATIGDTKMAREFYGIHRAVSGRMLNFDIWNWKGIDHTEKPNGTSGAIDGIQRAGRY